MTEETGRAGNREEDRDDCDELTCRQAVSRVYEYLDGELDPEKAEDIRCHLETCIRCYPYFNLERMFLDHIREAGLRPEKSRELREEVKRLLASVR